MACLIPNSPKANSCNNFYLAPMYSKDQTSKLKTQFWTNFGQYMKPIPGVSGLPVNWINYKTGIRNIHFKMDADNTSAVIAIEISHPKEAERLQYYNQFLSLKKVLYSTTTFNWQFNETFETDHKTISSISQQLDCVNILNQSDWPSIISFLKPRIIALDAFWEIVKDGFE
ncbi:MAG: DUF4268 domain-containing protein [Ferruginibacter sp.]